MTEKERIYQRLGVALREARERSGLTQAAAADLLGESKDTVAKWDQGRHAPELWKLPSIDRAYGLPVGWVLRRAGFLAGVAEWPLGEILSSHETGRQDIADFVADLLRGRSENTG